MATTSRPFTCPECSTATDVEVRVTTTPQEPPQLAVRFTCAGCGIILNATTSKTPLVWPDRPPRG